MQRQKKNSLNGNFRPLLAQKKRKGRTARRTLRLESLESRQMLSTVPWMPNHGDPDHTAADAGSGPEASAYVARDLQQGGDAPAARDSVTIINPDSMRPTSNPFRGCIPTDPCQLTAGVIRGQTIGKSLEHGPGIDGEAVDDLHEIWTAGSTTSIWTDGTMSSVIAQPQIGSEHWPPPSVHDSVQLGVNNLWHDAIPEEDELGISFPDWLGPPGLHDSIHCVVNNLWHDAIPEEDELGISFPDWLGPPGITEGQCQGACYVVGGEPASQLRSEIWTDGTMTNMSEFAAPTGVGDEPRDFSPDKKVAEGMPEDTDGLIAIIALNGETQGKDRVTPEDIKGNATDEDHKDWVIMLGDIKGEATDNDHKDWVITPDDIKGNATDEDHKDWVIMLGDIKGEAQDKDHKGIVML
ncbi:MAG: hypothetical protein VB835_16595 [Pirellulales bacterium]